MASDISWNPGLWASAGGAMPEGWRLVPFGQFLHSPKSLSVGVMYPGNDEREGVPLIRVGDVQEGGVVATPEMRISSTVHTEYKRTELAGDELLITLVGKPGICVVASPAMRGWNVARALAVAKLKTPALRPYLKAVLESPVMKSIVLSMLNTTVQPTLNLKEIKSLPIPMPPSEEEAVAIGNFVDMFNLRAALLHRLNSTVESIARALFKSWFVNFDPVRALQDGRDPDGMDAKTAALFPDTFMESELGLIPHGWRIGNVGEICSNPRSQAKPGQMPPDIPYIGLEHMPRKSISLHDAGTAEALESNKFWFEMDDVLFGKLRPYFHKVGLAPCKGVCSTDILVLRALKASSLGFLALLASSDDLVAHATQLSNGAKMPRTSWHDIEAYRVVLPPEPVLAAFDSLTRPLFRRIYANIDSSKVFAGMRDTLLPRLLSGRLVLPVAGYLPEEAIA